MQAHTQEIRKHINTLKAIEDIEAGQEVLIRYNSAQWFESKNIPYSDVDYANTMWQPDLHPLPCRRNIRHTTGADGRHSFAVMADHIPAGTVMETSLCVGVSLIVVDQFPVLWDFVLMDAKIQTQTVRARKNEEICCLV